MVYNGNNTRYGFSLYLLGKILELSYILPLIIFFFFLRQTTLRVFFFFYRGAVQRTVARRYGIRLISTIPIYSLSSQSVGKYFKCFIRVQITLYACTPVYSFTSIHCCFLSLFLRLAVPAPEKYFHTTFWKTKPQSPNKHYTYRNSL